MTGRRNADEEHLLLLLRNVRRDAGLRQVDLARRLGREQSFVSKYESGGRRLDVLELRRICDAVGISLATFVRRLERSLGSPRAAAETRAAYRPGAGRGRLPGHSAGKTRP